jgi:regulator of protease activity HflC (stomatin/prohibitin superfamily)
MFAIIVSALVLLAGIVAFFLLRASMKTAAYASLLGSVAVAVVSLIWASVEVIHPSNVGVVTVFGEIQDKELPAGLHFVGPIAIVRQVYTGVHVVGVEGIEAASKDLQSVHAKLTVNYHPKVAEIRELYRINVGLTYGEIIVPQAATEVFKAVVARYTAEELIGKRQEVSAGITSALNERLTQYHLAVQSTQLVNFGFSKAFDAAIEEKVTATQKAATAERNLVTVKFNAESRIAQAKGEAEAIRIQAEAVAKAGGEEYVRLKAVEKWNGTLPQYVTAGAPMPFINAGAK